MENQDNIFENIEPEYYYIPSEKQREFNNNKGIYKYLSNLNIVTNTKKQKYTEIAKVLNKQELSISDFDQIFPGYLRHILNDIPYNLFYDKNTPLNKNIINKLLTNTKHYLNNPNNTKPSEKLPFSYLIELGKILKLSTQDSMIYKKAKIALSILIQPI